MTPDCDAARIGLSPYLDGELDATERSAFERHLGGCAQCREALAAARALSAAMSSEVARERAPAGLAGRIQAGLAAADDKPVRRPWHERAPALAAAAIALFVLGAAIAHWALPLALESAAQSTAARDAVAAHVRALVSERLTDVASSDQHTVKPWFEGRVELAPPVEDLTAEGFRLVGGRVDVVDGRRVAALVYRHRQHVLTLFVGHEGADARRETAVHGFNLVQWTAGGMTFWAVSDLNRVDLERFATLLRARIR